MGRVFDLLGQRFGRLIVIGPAKSLNRSYRWPCRCDCGAETVVATTNLVSGHTLSCGCWRKEWSTLHPPPRSRTHDHAVHNDRSPTYESWSNMRARCENPRQPAYVRYGGRGIRVCERWRSFDNFLADMGERLAGTTIDRIDNDRGYEPGNCRWATRIMQRRNQRAMRRFTFRGETLIALEWADRLGVPRSVVKGRLRRGWSIERALTEPRRANQARAQRTRREMARERD